MAGPTALYLDFLYRPAKVEKYFGPAFDDPAAVHKVVESVSLREYGREALVKVLRDMADDYQATSRARANAEKLLDPETLVVFAGQQVGLFTGPLYTIYKALCTERWAAQLADQINRTVIPCFWLSTDDHDFAEVDHVVLPAGQQLATLRYSPSVPPAGDPLGRVRITPEIEGVLAQYYDSLPPTEFKDEVFATLRECYAPGDRIASAFGRLWARMFPESGLVPVSPCHKGFKKLAQPLLLKALTDDAALFEAYSKSSQMLAAEGYHRQVHKTPQQTFLFYQQFRRHNIHHDDQGGYVWEGADPVSREWLERMIGEHPEYFSPNVLLRPVIQNAMFPTIGVTLGPSETAYYAQIGGLHDHFGVPRPLICPRTTITLVEKSIRKRMDKHGLEFTALQKDSDGEIARVMRASFPEDLERQFDDAEKQIGDAFERLRPDVVRFEPTLDKPLRAAMHRAQNEMKQVAQKAYAANKRKQEETETQIRRLHMQLFPRGALQERVFNGVYYWARYGREFLDTLYRQFPAGERDHLLWEL
jgi:bacillithiol biosynthesis cysteine-adding enzyme BshC